MIIISGRNILMGKMSIIKINLINLTVKSNSQNETSAYTLVQ